jgi:hypothetical protein
MIVPNLSSHLEEYKYLSELTISFINFSYWRDCLTVFLIC